MSFKLCLLVLWVLLERQSQIDLELYVSGKDMAPKHTKSRCQLAHEQLASTFVCDWWSEASYL